MFDWLRKFRTTEKPAMNSKQPENSIYNQMPYISTGNYTRIPIDRYGDEPQLKSQINKQDNKIVGCSQCFSKSCESYGVGSDMMTAKLREEKKTKIQFDKFNP